MARQRIARRIEVGVINNHIGWLFHFDDGTSEAFSFDLPTIQGFIAALQQVIEQLENHLLSTAFRDTIGVQDSAQVRLTNPGESHE